MNGGRLASDSQRGSTRRWERGRPRYATSCGSQQYWSSGRQAALRTPFMQRAHLECTGPHALGMEFIRHVIEESIRVWYAHAKARPTLLKARLGLGSTTAWALQELRLHQQAEREGVQRELLE